VIAYLENIELSTLISWSIAPVMAIILAMMSLKTAGKKMFLFYISAYFIGLLTIIPMIAGLYYSSYLFLDHVRSIRRILFFSFVLVGFLAELTKFLFLRYHFMPKEKITKPVDGILFSVMIALGFSTVANIYFSYFWIDSINVKAINYSLPFANFLIAIIMGFFLGIGKFRRNHIDSLTGLSAAIFFQGFYNFCLLSHDYVLLALVGIGTLIIAVMLLVKSINSDTEGIM